MANDGWIPLNSNLPLAERLLPEEVAPALAFQYRLRLDLAFDIPSFPGIGSWSSFPWEEWRLLRWRLRLYDPSRIDTGPPEGLEDVWDELTGYYGDLGQIDPNKGAVYRDQGQLVFWVYGVLHGLQAYNHVWFVDGSSYHLVDRPRGARTLSACSYARTEELAEALCLDSGEMVQPPTGEGMAVERGWIFLDWTSPVIYAPILAQTVWDIQPTTDFDEARWSLWVRRVAAFGGTLDLDRDEILHWTDNLDGDLAFREAIGGRTRYVTRKQALRPGLEYGFPCHMPDGAAHVLAWSGRQAVVTTTPDGGTNWTNPRPVAGDGPPLCLRSGPDGELHTLRYGRDHITYQRLRPSGAACFQAPICSAQAVGSAALETRRHGIMEAHISNGPTLTTYKSTNGGVAWKKVAAIRAPGLVMDARTDRDNARHVLSSDGQNVVYTALNTYGQGRYASQVSSANHLAAGLAARADGEMLAQVIAPSRTQYVLSRDSGVEWRPL